jgi:hypothetical protein
MNLIFTGVGPETHKCLNVMSYENW